MPNNPNEIITIQPLLGATIIDATIWGDGSSMSLKLSNGGILQISAEPKAGDELREAIVRFEIEYPTQPYDPSTNLFMQWWKQNQDRYDSFGAAQAAWMNLGGDPFDNGFKEGDI